MLLGVSLSDVSPPMVVVAMNLAELAVSCGRGESCCFTSITTVGRVSDRDQLHMRG